MAKVDTPDAPQVVGPKVLQPPRPARPPRAHPELDVPFLEDVPRASLDGPAVGRAFDLTPSPVPRVSLLPPSEPLDARALSRQQPTIAIRNGKPPAQPQPPRWGAPAVTAPPQRRSSRRSKVAQRLVEDVRSSKREIVLGLIIGIGLSALLGVVVKRYLDRPYADARGSTASPSPALVTDQLGLEPAPERPALEHPAEGETSIVRELAEASEPTIERDAPRAEAVRVNERRSAAAPRAARPKNRAKPKERARTGEPPTDPRFPPAEPRRSAPLSPSESAGLGLELPF